MSNLDTSPITIFISTIITTKEHQVYKKMASNCIYLEQFPEEELYKVFSDFIVLIRAGLQLSLAPYTKVRTIPDDLKTVVKQNIVAHVSHACYTYFPKHIKDSKLHPSVGISYRNQGKFAIYPWTDIICLSVDNTIRRSSNWSNGNDYYVNILSLFSDTTTKQLYNLTKHLFIIPRTTSNWTRETAMQLRLTTETARLLKMLHASTPPQITVSLQSTKEYQIQDNTMNKNREVSIMQKDPKPIPKNPQFTQREPKILTMTQPILNISPKSSPGKRIPVLNPNLTHIQQKHAVFSNAERHLVNVAVTRKMASTTRMTSLSGTLVFDKCTFDTSEREFIGSHSSNVHTLVFKNILHVPLDCFNPHLLGKVTTLILERCDQLSYTNLKEFLQLLTHLKLCYCNGAIMKNALVPSTFYPLKRLTIVGNNLSVLHFLPRCQGIVTLDLIGCSHHYIRKILNRKASRPALTTTLQTLRIGWALSHAPETNPITINDFKGLRTLVLRNYPFNGIFLSTPNRSVQNVIMITRDSRPHVALKKMFVGEFIELNEIQ